MKYFLKKLLGHENLGIWPPGLRKSFLKNLQNPPASPPIYLMCAPYIVLNFSKQNGICTDSDKRNLCRQFLLISFWLEKFKSHLDVFLGKGMYSNSPVSNGRLPSSCFFLKSPVLRWSWLECQIFMNFTSQSQFL